MKFFLFFSLSLFIFSANAANPAQQEDARIEREKVLRAADQIEIILPQIESLKTEVQTLKAQVDRLQLENATLKKSLSTLETSRTKEREALLDEVSKILADSGSSKATLKTPTKNSVATTTNHTSLPKSAITTTNETTKEQVGYEHVVGEGQTVSSIVKAFNQAGIKVTVNDIIKANNLGADAKVRVGQKLFIPKK